MNNISVQSATQLNKILSFLPENKKVKIPQNIWKILDSKSNNNIDTKINEISDITEEKLLSETRKYLSFIFLNYLSTQEESEEYIKITKNNEEQHQDFLRKKYDINKMFDNRNILNEHKENKGEITNLPMKHKEGFFEFIFNKLKKLFMK